MSITVAFSDLNTWLSNAAANTADTAYSLNVTGLTESNTKYSYTTGTIGYVLKSNSTKYVNLSDTVIPSSVTNMYGTFYGCTSLVTAPAIPSSVTNMYGTFYGCTSLVTAPAIPSSVTNMYYTFYGCTSLVTAPAIPSSVTNMYYTFYGCTSLVTAPAIPSSVTNMTFTFYVCTSLVTAPAIPSSVTNMTYTFYGCTSLVTAPAIPSSVTDMAGAFYGCTSLVSVYKMKAYPAITGTNCFTNDSSVRIFVPEDNYYEWISNAATWGLTASQIYKYTFIHFDKNSVTSNSIIYFVEKLSCASAPLSMKITDICFDSDILSAVTVDKMLYKISGNNIFVCVKATIGTIKDTTKNPYVSFIHEVYDASGNKIDFTQGGYYVYPYSASTEKYIESFYDIITAPIVKFTTGEKYDYTL